MNGWLHEPLSAESRAAGAIEHDEWLDQVA
jgi:hypothetical protein